jgi:hypothetical protein
MCAAPEFFVGGDMRSRTDLREDFRMLGPVAASQDAFMVARAFKRDE